LFLKCPPTGNVIINLKEIHSPGEILRGNLEFVLSPKEFVPASSVVTVSLGNLNKKFLLSQLIDNKQSNGSFYMEGKNISGRGEGYGASASVRVFPFVDFKLRIAKEVSQNGKRKAVLGEHSNSSKNKTNKTEVVSNNKTEVVSNNKTEVVSNNKTESKIGKTIINKSEVSISHNKNSSILSLTGDSIKSIVSNNTENNHRVISRQVSKNKVFVYTLKRGESVELVKNSVSYKNNSIGDSSISLVLKNGKVFVSTNYSIEEKQNKTLDLKIPLNKLNLVANKSSVFSVS